MEKLFENNNNINEDPDLLAVWSHREIFNISFRTNFSKNAILFVAGDSKSNLKLTIEKGELLTTHQLENTDKRFIRVQDLAQRMPLRFDDNVWHSICIIREIHSPGFKGAVFSIRLIVDNVFDQQVKQFTPQLEWLGNSFFYIGGVPQTLSYLMPSDYLLPFRGCLKNIFFQSGPIEINLIQLADQGFGQSNVQTFGDIVFSCMPSAQNAPLIFSFNNGNNYTKLPPWRSPSRGNLAFQFRTLTPDGLILYHGMLQCKNFTICDYLAFELINGHLFMIVNLGSGDIRLQASAKALNDGLWHSLVMERSGRKGYISVDSLRTEFSCPGISANLDIDEPIFLGAVPWPDPFSSQQNNNNHINIETVTIIELEEKLEFKRNFPSSVWTINLQKGFLGCMKNIRLNGINIEIAHMFQSNKLLLQNEKQLDNNNYKTKINESIFLGCPFSFSFDYCKKSGNKNLCKNGGVCSSFHNTFICDCSDTPFDGINCQQKPHPIPFPLPSSLSAKFIFSDPWQLEAENLEIKFKPKLEFNFNEEKKLFVLIDTKLFKNKQKLLEKDENKQRFLVAITGTGGILINWIFQGNEENIFNLTSANITNNWNTFKLIRRGHRIGVKLNGKWNNITLNNNENNKRLILLIKELAIAQPIGTNKISNNLEHLFRFHGDLRILSLNGHDLLRHIRIMKRQKGSSTSSQNKEELNSEYFEGLKEIKMENKHRNLSVDKIWKMEGKYYQTTKSQPLNNKKFNNESSFSSISSTFFFTKSPLGCLRQNARNCIPEPSIEDSFFTPIISKSLNWGEQIKTTTLSTPTTELTTNKLPINSFSTSSLTTTTTTLKTITTTTSRKRPHSWTRTKTNVLYSSKQPLFSSEQTLMDFETKNNYSKIPSTSEKQQKY
ncbi:hypothetical protein Mgra_00003712 [Meloidogyne graminicola]|uniref:LAM_G_DOMAIN domain-containing protein n=1 Tax=Meloidogyne graminicola TaxID=189291 RepID=A0A8S9ZU14_9BILA|nr:hypothetical protein Mgra_00003712 [Meloidogyne graminicola]